MLTDFYEITMANGFFSNGRADQIAYFDMFFRKIPDDGGFAIMAGVQQLVEYLERLSFTSKDIEYLKSRNIFSQNFLDYLKNLEFSCDVGRYQNYPDISYNLSSLYAGLSFRRSLSKPWFC